MRITIAKEKILRAIQTAERVAGKSSITNSTASIQIEAVKNGLYVKASNPEIGLEIFISASVGEVGGVVLPSGALFSFLSNIQGTKEITLESDEKSLKVSGGNYGATLRVLGEEYIPVIPKSEAESSIVIKSSDFIEGLNSVWFSASISSVKPELSSVYVYNDNGFMCFVATDSFRLAEKKIKTNKNIDDFPSVLIPRSNVAEIVKIFEENDSDLTIELGKNHVTIKNQNIYVISRVVSGVFPDYRQVVPKSSLSEATIFKSELEHALKVGSVFSDKFNQVNVSLDVSKKRIDILTKNNDTGESKATIQATTSGENIAMSFNIKYIVEGLSIIKNESISLSWNGERRPIIMRSINDVSFFYLIMPMNR